MGQCRICKKRSTLISAQLGVCIDCIRGKPEVALTITDEVHAASRSDFSLPPQPPRDLDGISCGFCANNCQIGENNKGYCGLVFNKNGQLHRTGGTENKGVLTWYFDSLPTNCVAGWFCPGCTGAGHPKYAYRRHAEDGYLNLAIFYGACSFNCLYCQNWHFKNLLGDHSFVLSAEELCVKIQATLSLHAHVMRTKKKSTTPVSCVCFFGGDPSVQMSHALKTSELLLETARKEERIFRICWETNGYWNEAFGLKAAETSLVTGGILKFDLKTWNNNLHRALCGVSNNSTLKNFERIGSGFFKKRPELPILTASTLLVPGYVDTKEIDCLAEWMASIDPKIPYTLLAFSPQYVMNDLPCTGHKQAIECKNVATKHLANVRIGNVHLLN